MAERGVAAVTHRAVAGELDMAASAVAHHFRTRMELVRAGIEATLRRSVVAYTPDHSASLGTDYSFAVADVGTVRAHVDANYSSGFYSQGSDLVKTRPYWQINARLSLGEVRMAGGGPELEFALWGKTSPTNGTKSSNSR